MFRALFKMESRALVQMKTRFIFPIMFRALLEMTCRALVLMMLSEGGVRTDLCALLDCSLLALWSVTDVFCLVMKTCYVFLFIHVVILHCQVRAICQKTSGCIKSLPPKTFHPFHKEFQEKAPNPRMHQLLRESAWSLWAVSPYEANY